MEYFNSQFYAFILVTLVLTVTPGVDTFIVMRNVLRGGKSDGIITGIGICSGLFIHASLSALGISIILVQSAFLFNCVKMLGALYLIWLGISGVYQSYHRKGMFDISLEDREISAKLMWVVSYREGLLSNLLNPKPAIFYLAFFPQFIDTTGPVFIQSILLTCIQFLLGITWLSLLSLLVFRVKNLFHKPLFYRILNSASGAILIALGIKLGLETD